MKFILTGGGTGGHFYPLIAVAESLNQLQEQKAIRELDLFYISNSSYDQAELDRLDIEFRAITAGKRRVYFSPLNIIDSFKTALGIVQALWKVFVIYPDAVFSKGGFAAFPVVLAARILSIPVIIHESDTVPGRVNLFSGRFAKTVMLAFEETKKHFPKSKDVRVVGLPIRRDLLNVSDSHAREYLHLKEDIPVLVVLGGSQGAERINNLIIEVLPELVKNYYIVHQTGRNNIEAVKQAARFVLDKNEHADRYIPFDYLDSKSTRMSAAIASLIISRAGSALFEIAAWGVPSILIPLPQSAGAHQLHNSRVYWQAGACLVIEENNLQSSVFLSELDKIMSNKSGLDKMSQAALNFHQPEAAYKIASELIKIGEKHEK